MNSINLIPQPEFLQAEEGIFSHTGVIHIVGDAFFTNEIRLAESQFKDAGLTGETGGQQNIRINLSKEVSGEESYELQIQQTGIEIHASGRKGAYNGLQSLRQLVLLYRNGNSVAIPCAGILDSPRFEWRGCMLDTSRHFYSVSFIKKLIDIASLHHMNVFHWHLTDDQGWRLPVEGYPALTDIGAWRKEERTTWDCPVGGFYSRDDIREIVAFAAERHVQVVPEVDLPGHASAILAAYPELGCTGGPYRVEDRFGIFEDVLCAGNDKIFDLFASIFDSLVELFPSPYVHIGGDEVKFNRWKACPKCETRMKELSLDKSPQLQSWITVRLVEMLKERGRTTIGWDEVLEGTEKFSLPQDVVVMSWRGREGGMEASAKGHRVIMTPMTDGCYLNFKPIDSVEEPGHLEVSTVRQAYEMEAVPPQMTKEQESLVMGGQCNLWSEVIYASRIAEYMLFPRLCAIAESLWTARKARNFESFANKLPEHRKKLDALDVCQYRGPLE